MVVSGRGQITLPAALRKRLGLKGGDVVILEDRGPAHARRVTGARDRHAA